MCTSVFIRVHLQNLATQFCSRLSSFFGGGNGFGLFSNGDLNGGPYSVCHYINPLLTKGHFNTKCPLCVACPIKAWHSFVERLVGWLSAYAQSSVKVRSPQVSSDIHFSTHVPPKRPNGTWECLLKFFLVWVGAECVVSLTQHKKGVSPTFSFRREKRERDKKVPLQIVQRPIVCKRE